MDTCLTDWNTEVLEVDRKFIGNSVVDNGLMELLWHNGEVVLNSQNNKKSSYDDSTTKFNKKEVHNKLDQSNPNNLIDQDDDDDEETASWIHCPIDEAFEKDFCSNLFSAEIPSVENNENVFKFGGAPKFAPISLPPPRIPSFNSPDQRGCKKTNGNIQLPPLKKEQGEIIRENSGMTIGSSHCGSNQVVTDVGLRMVDKKNCGGAWKISPQSESTERETLGQPITSSSGGSGNSFWKTSNISNETSRHKKRKSREMEESECQSDAPESELAAENKSSQKSGTTRRSRVAEVHNLSERKRRDRINEKMKALQELIPHSNKSDKASMLDEAIEYMKSLQLQLQLMWMGSGMAPMMHPVMQQYMSRIGMATLTLPQIQNLMRLSMAHTPNINNQATSTAQNPVFNNYQNHQMQNPSFTQQYANYMNFHSMQNNTSQAVNMFNLGSHSSQQNHALAQPNNGNGSI